MSARRYIHGLGTRSISCDSSKVGTTRAYAKGKRQLNDCSLVEAIAAAVQMDDELKPSFGVTVEDGDGDTVAIANEGVTLDGVDGYEIHPMPKGGWGIVRTSSGNVHTTFSELCDAIAALRKCE